MAKEMQLYLSYLQFTLTLAKIPTLMDVLTDIGEQFEPRQKDSIFSLIKQAAGLSGIFISCMTSTDAQIAADHKDAEQLQILANKFIEVHTFLNMQLTEKQQDGTLLQAS